MRLCGACSGAYGKGSASARHVNWHTELLPLLCTWQILLFYPDGKRSSLAEGHIEAGHAGPGPMPAMPAPGVVFEGDVGAGGAAGPEAAAAAAGAAAHQIVQHLVAPRLPQQPQRRDTTVSACMQQPPCTHACALLGCHRGCHPAMYAPHPLIHLNIPAAQNEYAALFVALIGEGPSPQGIVNTSEGKVVRAFHRFTLVDQTGQGRDLTKGRTRDAGAVKISCARQDPNARNCHGYRKFVKRTILEDPSKGYLLNDTILIKSVEHVQSEA